MKLIIEQGALQKALARVTGVVASRNTIPILDNVAIDARGGEVWLTATDLVIEAKARVNGAQIEQEGEITASGSLLSDLVRSAPAGAEIVLSFGPDDPRLKVQFGRSKYNVPVLPRVDFPVLKPLERPSTVTVSAVDLKAMIGRVAFAQSTEVKARPYLCGVHLQLVPGGPSPAPLRMVATDGHRLAWADAPVVGKADVFRDILLPSKAVAEWSKTLDGAAGEVRLSLSEAAAILELPDAAIRTKVIDGTPVDYMRVVPRQWDREVVVNRQLLLETTRRVALISDRDRATKLVFDGDVLTLQAVGMESGQGREELDVTYGGEAFEIGFNARYLVDALGQTEAEAVVLRMTDEAAPVRVEPSVDDAEHGPVLNIVMPQRF